MSLGGKNSPATCDERGQPVRVDAKWTRKASAPTTAVRPSGSATHATKPPSDPNSESRWPRRISLHTILRGHKPGHKCQSVSFVSSRRNVRNLLWSLHLGVTPVRFCAPQFSTVAATLRICADWSQKQSQIGTAGVKRPSYLPERTARWTSDLISAVGKRTT